MGTAGAAALHKHLVLRILSTAIDAKVGLVDLWCTPSLKHSFFFQCARKFEICLFTQIEGDLGSRMAQAFNETLKKTSQALLIGSDCPSLTADDLREATDALRHGIDAVIGPAEDGGYVLIGLRQHTPDLFTRISWGTGSVLDQTRARLRGLGWKWHELPERWDVDRPEDVERLKREGYL
jgi:rSAM/selenodomain-associated transferase 1